MLEIFKQTRTGAIASCKSAIKLIEDLESVTVSKPSLRTANKDTMEKSFFLQRKNGEYYFLMPSAKTCGMRSSIFMPFTTVRILSGKDPETSSLEYSIQQYGPMAIAVSSSIVLLGIGIAAFSDLVMSLLTLAAFAFFALIGAAITLCITRIPCDKTEKELIRIATHDLNKYKQDQAQMEDLLKEYDRLAGIDDSGWVN